MARTFTTMSDVLSYQSTGPADSEAATNENHYGLKPAMLWSLAIRALILAIGIFSTWTGNVTPTLLRSGYPWLAWDGVHYANIVRHGYAANMTGAFFYDIAFFPLLPFLAKPLTLFFSPEVSLVVIGNACSVVGFFFFYKWLRELTHARLAFIATILLAAWPGSVYYCGGLTEGPFMMVVAITLYLLQKKRFWPAAILASIGTLLRPTGVALSAMVAFYALFNMPVAPYKKRLVLSGLIGLVAVSGAAAYESFLWHRYGKYDVYLKAQAYWEIGDNMRLDAEKIDPNQAPRMSPKWFLEKSATPQAWNRVIAVGLFGVILAGFWKRRSLPRVLFIMPLIIFVMTGLPNHGLRMSSIIRYESAAPMLIALMALWLAPPERRRWLVAFLIVCGAVQMYYAFLFSRGGWIG